MAIDNAVDGRLAFITDNNGTKAEAMSINRIDGNVTVEKQIRIKGGAPAQGKVLTSDDNGLATWQPSTGGSNAIAVLSAGSYGGSATGLKVGPNGAMFTIYTKGANGYSNWMVAVTGVITGNGNVIMYDYKAQGNNTNVAINQNGGSNSFDINYATNYWMRYTFSVSNGILTVTNPTGNVFSTTPNASIGFYMTVQSVL